MLILTLCVRVLIALATRTVFQPDEYFQALEPAHHAVFGYGHLTWEWLAENPIRSIIYPAINIPIYWLLKVTGLSERPLLGDALLIYGPRLLHGLLAALTDMALCDIARRWVGTKYMSTVLLVSVTSFFNALALSRSLVNSLETTLTTLALSCYPWDVSITRIAQRKETFVEFLVFSALACMFRPTNAILWIFLYANMFWSLRSTSVLWTVVRMCVVAVILALVSLCLLDSAYYGSYKTMTITIVPLNFLRTNLTSVSLFYGANPWHYYLTQGLPILCTTALPFVLHGIYLVLRDESASALQMMFKAVVWYIGIFSLIGHKEWRFIHPVLPILHLFAAKSLVDLAEPRRKGNNRTTRKRNRDARFKTRTLWFFPPIRSAHLALVLSTLPISLYIILFYCSAPISVLSYIRSLPRSQLKQGIGFLMPCHSTPGQAYIHRKELGGGVMWSLGCEPPLGLVNEDKDRYKDQTDIFFSAPFAYLATYFSDQVDPAFPVSLYPSTVPGSPLLMPDPQTGKYPWRHEWPRRFVLFGQLLKHEGVRELLEEKGYREVWKKGREWEGEGERLGGVRVWEWQGPRDSVGK